MMLILNFLVSVVLAPAVLAGVAYVTTKDQTLAVLSAVLSALSGLVALWDVVIRRGPKLGADWRVPHPKNFALINLVVYALVIPFIVGVFMWAVAEFGKAPPQRHYWLWLLILIPACLWVPKSKEGPDAGEPLGTD